MKHVLTFMMLALLGASGALACWCANPAEYPGVPRLERPGMLLDLLEELERSKI